MFYRIIEAGFLDVAEANDVRLHVRIRMIDRIADTCLNGQINHNIKAVFCEQAVNQAIVYSIAPDEEPLT